MMFRRFFSIMRGADGGVSADGGVRIALAFVSACWAGACRHERSSKEFRRINYLSYVHTHTHTRKALFSHTLSQAPLRSTFTHTLSNTTLAKHSSVKEAVTPRSGTFSLGHSAMLTRHNHFFVCRRDSPLRRRGRRPAVLSVA
jgi:hypothetical protein